MRTGGIVLCGGCSIRMGRPKEMLSFGDELMLSRVVRLVSEVVNPIVVVAAVGQELPVLPPVVRVVRDARPNRGPLEGISAGLRVLRQEVDAVFVTACDVPLLKPEFIRRVIDLTDTSMAAVPRINGYDQPLSGVYRVRALAHVQRLLAEGQRRAARMVDEVCARRITAEELIDVDPELDSLWNVNTKEDYQTALERAGLAPARPA